MKRRYLDPKWWLVKMSSRRCPDNGFCPDSGGPHDVHLTWIGTVRYLGWGALLRGDA